MEPSKYVKRLPIGRPIPFPPDGIPGWEIFPFEGDLRVKQLEPPVLPEPPRSGEAGRECPSCATADEGYVWTDEQWRLKSLGPRSLPAVLILEPRAHHDLADLPPELSAELGPVIQRVEAAVSSLDGVARVHLNRWGDGGSHLHLWFFARPEGMMQLRGTCLPLWDDVLPVQPDTVWQEMLHRVAAAMAAGGGVARC